MRKLPSHKGKKINKRSTLGRLKRSNLIIFVYLKFNPLSISTVGTIFYSTEYVIHIYDGIPPYSPSI